MERVVLPLSGLSSWLVVLAGGLMMLHVLGINVQPLLTVTGVSGIIVGLSAQSVMANMISGINLVRISWLRHALLRPDACRRSFQCMLQLAGLGRCEAAFLLAFWGYVGHDRAHLTCMVKILLAWQQDEAEAHSCISSQDAALASSLHDALCKQGHSPLPIAISSSHAHRHHISCSQRALICSSCPAPLWLGTELM